MSLFLEKCPYCGKSIAWGAVICPNCGASRQQIEDADSRQGVAIVVFVAAFLILWPIMKTYNYISETFDTIDYKSNQWCGDYQNHKITLFKDDIKNGGSSRCASRNVFSSWRESEKIGLEKASGFSFPDWFYSYSFANGGMVIIEGTIKGNTLQVKNIKRLEK